MILASALLALAAPQPSPSCTPATAVRAGIVEINRDPGRFVGRCVTLAGPASGVAMFSDVDAIYRGQWPSVFGAAVAGRGRIGLYNAGNRLPAGLFANGPAHLAVTGIVDTCERKYERARAGGGPGAIVTLSGYCHFFPGPVIEIASYAHDPAIRYERLAGEAARRRVGDLVAAGPRTPGFAILQRFAGDVSDAVRRGDRAALARLHDFRPDTRDEGDRRVLAYLLDEPGSPFAALRRGAGGRAAIFVRRNASIARDEGVSGVICFCRTADCSERWPISILDAANGPDKPYACTIIEPRNWQPRGAGLDTQVDRAWLREPARTAFRRIRPSR